jgi:hypothetical protein
MKAYGEAVKTPPILNFTTRQRRMPLLFTRAVLRVCSKAQVFVTTDLNGAVSTQPQNGSMFRPDAPCTLVEKNCK